MFAKKNIFFSGYDSMSINSSSNSISCWLPGPSNYPNMSQQQFYPQDSITAPSCTSSSILPHWTPNDHLLMDSIPAQGKPLINAQNSNNIPSPVTSLSNEFDYMSINRQDDFPQMLGFQRQAAADKNIITDISDSNMTKISSYRQSALDKNFTSEVADISSRDLGFSRHNVTEKNYLSEISESAAIRTGWDNQYTDQFSGRQPDNLLTETASSEATSQILRTEPVTSVAQDVTNPQYPWILNRWTCF